MIYILLLGSYGFEYWYSYSVKKKCWRIILSPVEYSDS